MYVCVYGPVILSLKERWPMKHAKQSPLLLCCISDSTAAIHCVSPLEIVFSMC